MSRASGDEEKQKEKDNKRPTVTPLPRETVKRNTDSEIPQKHHQYKRSTDSETPQKVKNSMRKNKEKHKETQKSNENLL